MDRGSVRHRQAGTLSAHHALIDPDSATKFQLASLELPIDQRCHFHRKITHSNAMTGLPASCKQA
jgi:hypothetical protein